MQEYANEIVSELRSILDKHKGSIAVSSLKQLLSKGLRDKLCIKSNTSAEDIMKRIGSVVEENFLVHNKRNSTYIMTPRDPEDLVIAQQQEYADEIVSELQSILDKHRGFILFSQVASSFSKGLRDKLCIKSNTPIRLIRQKIMPAIEENFIIRKKGQYTYVLTPCELDDLVYAWLSETEPVPLGELVRLLKPFRKAETLALLTEMVNAGKVRVEFQEAYRVNIFAWGAAREAVSERVETQAARKRRQAPAQAISPEEYTQAKFRAAYDELRKHRELVRICDLRRTLNWPREVFDGMLRTLRDNRTILITRADESMMTDDELRDCFLDENRVIQGYILKWQITR